MSADKFIPTDGWGPDRKCAALSITFDNFGEAADIEHGMWGDQPVGSHYTADFLPVLIDLLGEIRATYFVEASNALLYPDALRTWRDAGHEIGLHAWRHERWAECSPDRRQSLLDRSMTAMRNIGIEPIGFRPPGGAIPEECWGEFASAGLAYASDLGTPGVTRKDTMLSLPFAWRGVDTYMLEELLRFVRQRNGDPETPFGLAAWRSELRRAVAETIASGSHRAIIFHPGFLAQSEDKLAVVSELIEIASNADMWIAGTGEVARFAASAMGIGEKAIA